MVSTSAGAVITSSARHFSKSRSAVMILVVLAGTRLASASLARSTLPDFSSMRIALLAWRAGGGSTAQRVPAKRNKASDVQERARMGEGDSTIGLIRLLCLARMIKESYF